MKDFKKLFRYLGVGLLIIGGLCMLLTIAALVSFISSVDIFGEEQSVSMIINFVTVSIFCFILGWVLLDFFQ